MWRTPGTATALTLPTVTSMKGAKPCWNSFNKHFYGLAIAGLFLFSEQKGEISLYNLIVTEKPSVARTISKVLGVTARRDSYLEGGGYLISWCVGHLVELAPPGAYDPRLERWDCADLPILPERWQYLVSSSTKQQFDVLCQ